MKYYKVNLIVWVILSVLIIVLLFQVNSIVDKHLYWFGYEYANAYSFYFGLILTLLVILCILSVALFIYSTPIQKRIRTKRPQLIACLIISTVLALTIIYYISLSGPITVSADELYGNYNYNEKIVKVTGTVSKLGEVRGPYFLLDGKIWVHYHHSEYGSVLPEHPPRNGDRVTVVGLFIAPDQIEATHIERVEK